MTQLIDLGKLRFYFAGLYNPATVYELNDVVKFGGNVYVYIYALAASDKVPTNTTYWSLMIEGLKFSGQFNPSTEYKVGDGVAHGSTVYISIKTGTGNTPPNAEYWSKITDGIQFEGAYSGSASYQKNDIVTYGGNTYIAVQDTTNNKPTVDAYWDVLTEGIDATGVYNDSATYVVNQLVAYGNAFYKCIAETTGNEPTDTAYWELYLQGLGPQGAWSETQTYYKNDIVVNGSTVYIYKSDQPTSGNPTTSVIFWQVLTSGITTRGDWAPSTEYYSGDVVTRGGNTFITSEFHASSAAFSTDLTAGKWTKYNGGVRYRGPWTAQTVYLEGDIITDGENARIANKDFTSGDYLADNENDWDILAKGASGSLPAQGGRTGYVLTTDGSEASFERDIVALRFGDGTDAADFEQATDDSGNPLTDVASLFVQNSDSFIQLAIANAGNDDASSTDFIAYTHDGDNASGWIDMGITGDAFDASEFGITGPNDGYIFVASPKLNVKEVTSKSVSSFVATLTSTSHGFSIGDIVVVSIDDADYDGSKTITAVDENTFSYAAPGVGNQSSTSVTGGESWKPNGNGDLVLATSNNGKRNAIILAAGGFNSGREQVTIIPDQNVHIEIDTASTSATTGALTVVGGVGITGDQFIAGDLTVIGNVDLQGVTKLPVGAGATAYETSAELSDAVIIAAGTSSSFVQNALVNLGTGTSSSADYIAYAAEGDNISGWIDMGITNAAFDDPSFGVTGPHDGYIFMSAPEGTTGAGNLVIATDNTGTDNKIIFAAGGLFTGSEQMSITPNQNVHIEIATPSISPTTGAFTVVGGMGVQGDINVAGNVSIAGEITFGGSGTVVETENLAVVNPMIFVATGNPTGDGLTFAFLGESRSARQGLVLTEAISYRDITDNVATLVTTNSHLYEVNDTVVVSGVDDLASPKVVIVYSVSSNVVTLTTNGVHGLSTGQQIDVVGVNAAVNGTAYTITGTPTTSTLTYSKTTSDVAPSPVSAGTLQRVNLPDIFNGSYTITAVPNNTSFKYARTNANIALSQPSRVFTTVVSYSLTNGVATLVLTEAPTVTVGSAVTVSGVDSRLNGVRTITAVSTSAPFSLSYVDTDDDIESTTLTQTVSATISSRNRTDSVSTITTSAAHGFITGESVTIANLSSTFNGTFTIASTPTDTTFTYAQALANVDETAGAGTATSTRPNFGAYSQNGYLGASVVTDPLRGQYTGLARNQARQVWYFMGGLSEKPSDTIDFSVPGVTFTREDLNVDTLEARNVVLDKDPWQQTDAVNLRTFNLTPSIINSSTTLVAKRYNNTTEGFVNATGNYMVNHTAAVTLTLPESPLIGDTIMVTDVSAAGAATNYITLARNGQPIQGLAEDLVIDITSASIKLMYSNSTAGWRLTA
jgi:hypothetical protein